ncbi:alpha/beta fold hydrolase [Brevibacillus composti]|uniref:alpha/beta fold hydrolase n=1 Tax=Brevibacillus composti TaxID=2796470 RepID=UPI001E2D09A3|nr:alpha/beta hydrolase [Brevibacillus composti]
MDREPTMKTALLPNGVTLAYQEAGSGDALCLVHGFCGSSAYWQRIIPPLAQSHHVLAPDLRGHGKSSVPEETYTVEKMAEDLLLLLDEAGIQKVALLGHSLGGYVALAFAERYPHRLSALGLIHSPRIPMTRRQRRTGPKEWRASAATAWNRLSRRWCPNCLRQTAPTVCRKSGSG